MDLIRRALRRIWRLVRPYEPQHKGLPRRYVDKHWPAELAYGAPWLPAPAPLRALPTMVRVRYTPPCRVAPRPPLPPYLAAYLNGHTDVVEAVESMYSRAQAAELRGMLLEDQPHA